MTNMVVLKKKCLHYLTKLSKRKPMNSRQKLIEGLTILGKYDPIGYGVASEHDIVYGISSEPDISLDDQRRLTELDWHISSNSNGWAFFV